MSLKVPKRNHFVTAVAFDPVVVEYLNDLAKRMRMSRSWVINTIVQEYAMFIENKNIAPLGSPTIHSKR
jgi:predicted transcriptional regulator